MSVWPENIYILYLGKAKLQVDLYARLTKAEEKGNF